MSKAGWGCVKCWGGDAESALSKIESLPGGQVLVDESHLIIGTRRCPDCNQCFVSVMTETVDWWDGDDPVHRTFMPITDSELADAASRRPAARWSP